jgi:hypothetical protein
LVRPQLLQLSKFPWQLSLLSGVPFWPAAEATEVTITPRYAGHIGEHTWFRSRFFSASATLSSSDICASVSAINRACTLSASNVASSATRLSAASSSL